MTTCLVSLPCKAMHEWALAEAVLQSVQDEAAKHDGTVRSVVILFGELQRIDPDIFRGGLEELGRQYPFDPDVFTVTIDPARFTCLACNNEWGLEDQPELGEQELEAIHFLPEASHTHLRCPGCGSADFRIDKGRGVSIGSIDIEVEADE